MSRIVISEINKAINNNQNYLIIAKSAKFKKEILSVLHAQGFIQGLEFRGKHIIIYLKRQYWKNWGVLSKSIIKIAPLNLSKSGTISAKKWKKVNFMVGNAYCHILSTDHGIINNSSNNFYGGIPLIKIL